LPAAEASLSIAFDHVGKVYSSSSGPVHALHGIDLSIPRGSIFGIIGRSGAGKSSLLRTINRLEAPTSGRVLVEGQDVAALDDAGLIALRRRVGMVFQHFNLLSAKTAWDNIALPLVVSGAPKARIHERVAEVVALTSLEGKERAYPSRLSGGQKQRVGIARALVHSPDILLCNEATSALDPETTLSILRLLKDINRRFRITIVLITHEMSVIREICDQVLLLDGGRIAEIGPVWRVFGDPEHPATRALLKPLNRDIPADIAERLKPQPGLDASCAVVELTYMGKSGLEPDPLAIARAFGGPFRLLQSSLDRIEGHVYGRLLTIGPAELLRDVRQFAQGYSVMSPQMVERLWAAFLDTLAMVGASVAIAVALGVPLAVFLVLAAPGGLIRAPHLHRALSAVVNGFRATPFIILLVALLPITRLLVGTTIGVWAAVVPLAASATPFFARIAEVSLREVDAGLIEAAQAMGCNRRDIVRHVLLPEALPGIIGGATITIVSVIGASAMAGAVGSGGLGDMAIRYGYQRFDTQIMAIVIVILVALVCLIQLAGDRLVRRLRER
jgi:D-methionine transport system ATP-binding protein